ncbi:hypothetical protein QUB47_13155 [Microcoleus sp. AT9_B5]
MDNSVRPNLRYCIIKIKVKAIEEGRRQKAEGRRQKAEGISKNRKGFTD